MPDPLAPPDALLARLRQALHSAAHPARDAPLRRLPDTGLAHDHVLLGDSGCLARLPKQSQMGLPAQANLDYQAACFERASEGGHAPRLLGRLAPSAELPRGGLLVQAIEGRPAQLPQDLHATVRALAALHALDLPPPAQRAPLWDPPDPLGALAAEVAQQALHLDQAGLAPSARALVAQQLAALEADLGRWPRPPQRLIAFDGHPGNFLIRPDGEAVLVDLEKCRYSHPGLDLAHATLYTSTTWDLNSHAVLSPDQVDGAYRHWAEHAGAAAVGAGPWQLPLRRAMWLWSVTWCAKWRVLSGGQRRCGGDGEDWSAQASEPALVAHVRERVGHYLSAPVLQRVVAEFAQLQGRWRG